MLQKISKLIYSFFIPLFIRKKDYNLVILRYDSENFMFNTKVFFEYLLKNSTLNFKYIINSDDLRKKLTDKYGNHFIIQKTFKDIIFIAKAGTWITDGGFPLKTPFGHKNRVLINLWHGMPIKHVGIKGYSGLSKLRVYLQLKMYSKYYSAFCVTSKRFIPIVKESFLIDEDKIKVLGQPRNDLLFKQNNKDEILNDLYSNLPYYKKIILYAPTYRTSAYGGKSDLEPTKFFPFDDFDLEKLENFLEENNYIIFIRTHHLDNIPFKETKRIRLLNNNKIEDIFEILNIFDLLISDYSGMIYDFVLTKKSLLFLPYDLDEYIKSVGIYFDYNFIAKGPKPKSQKEFLIEIEKLLIDKAYFLEERNQLRKFIFKIENNNSQIVFEFLKGEINKYER